MSKPMLYEYKPMDEVFFFKAKKIYDYYATPKKYCDEIYKNYLTNYPIKEKLSILDVGCGLGELSEQFYKDGHDLTMIELNEDFIPILKERFPNAKIIHGDFLKLTWSFDIGGSFDIVVCNPPFGNHDGIPNIEMYFLMKILKSKLDIHNKTVIYWIAPGGVISNNHQIGDLIDPSKDLKLNKAMIARMKKMELWKTKDNLFADNLIFQYLDDVDGFSTTKYKCKLFRID